MGFRNGKRQCQFIELQKRVKWYACACWLGAISWPSVFYSLSLADDSIFHRRDTILFDVQFMRDLVIRLVGVD